MDNDELFEIQRKEELFMLDKLIEDCIYFGKDEERIRKAKSHIKTAKTKDVAMGWTRIKNDAMYMRSCYQSSIEELKKFFVGKL